MTRARLTRVPTRPLLGVQPNPRVPAPLPVLCHESVTFRGRAAAALGPQRLDLREDRLAQLVARPGGRERRRGVRAFQAPRPRRAADAEVERRAAVAARLAAGQLAAQR